MTAGFERALRLLDVRLGDLPVVVACSGGADSACALALARRVAPNARLVACYVDHGLRPRASIERDIAAVRAQARAAKAAVRIRKAKLGSPRSGSPEERARLARYAELEAEATERGASLVLTGHQRDDLVETSLLALARGSGLDGVAAMRPKRRLSESVMLARPLLWATKSQCAALVRELGIPYSEDETNADTRIPRNAVRDFVARLEVKLPQASRGIARSSVLLADDRELLEAMSAAAFEQARIGSTYDLATSRLRRLPVSLLRRVIRLAVSSHSAGLRNFSFEHCDAIARAIKSKRGGRFHAGPASVLLSSGKLVVEAPSSDAAQGAASFAPIDLSLASVPAVYSTPLGTLTLKIRKLARYPRARRAARSIQRLNAAALLAKGGLQLRLPREGDVCVPSGRTKALSLARFLGKAGVPKSRRDKVPLLCAGGSIAAALGQRVMASYEPKPRSPVLEVGWIAADS